MSKPEIKSGKEHLASLRDGREIFINGARVDDVTSHYAFRNVAGSVEKMFDFAKAPENTDLMTYLTPEGGRANRIWELPGTYQDLVKRRAGLEAWTGLHGGFLGRAPPLGVEPFMPRGLR